MKKIINIFLLNGDKFMPELHLKDPVFTYSSCGPFTKHCEACFAYDAAYSDSKDLAKRFRKTKRFSYVR